MRSQYVHILAAAFGMASWLAVNGVWVELPLLVNQMPESWNLASQMSIVIQLANIGPLVVTLMDLKCNRYLKLEPLIYVLLVIGVISQLLLCFFWDHPLNGRSIPFFILFFATSVVDCTSSVSFIPFMSRLQTRFLQSYFLGEGLSGFIPAVIGLIQGVGNVDCDGESPIYGEALFGVNEFFIMLSVLCFISLLAFWAISNYSRDYFVEDAISSGTNYSEMSDQPLANQREEAIDYKSPDVTVIGFSVFPDHLDEADSLENNRNEDFRILYALLFILCFFSNGFVPSISTFIAMPYGVKAYHASTILNTVANPIACIIANFKPIVSRRVFYLTFFITMVIMGFNIFLALSSPCPILVDTMAGSSIMVISTTLYMLFTTLLKVSFASVLRNKVNSMRLLLWFGAVTQIGSFCGAITSYPLVNCIEGIFVPRYDCQSCL